MNEPVDVFKYYDMSGGPEACWVYIGNSWGGQKREPRPYFMAAGRRQIAYRWIYELVHGVTLTPDQLILHSCDNGGYPIGCGNIHHMRLGTVQDNSDDMVARQRHGMPKTVVRAIRTLLEQGRTQQDIADLYGVSRETISAIATQRAHKTVE
jgi:DNA-binding XRE family transcriptional regulator